MSNALWVGVLVGVPVGAFAPEWAKIVVFLIALLLSDLAHGASRNLHNVHNVHNVHFMVPLWLIGVAGLAFGLWAWHYARKRGLGHLGQAELRTRWAAVRGSSRWGW
jgi:hypothetical protein